MISATFRRWRCLRPRWRASILLLVSMALMVGAWTLYRSWADRWQARVELRADGGVTVPLGFSPDGRAFATAGAGRITLWDSRTGLRLATWDVRADGFAQAGTFSPDGKTFAAAVSCYPAPMQVALIDVASGRTTSTFTSRQTNIFDLGVGFSADGKEISLLSASTSGLQEVATWDSSTGSTIPGRPLPLMKIPERPLAISPDRRLIVSTSRPGGTAWLRDLDALDRLPEPIGPMSAEPVSAATFSADGRRLAVGRSDGTIDIWEVASRRRIATLKAHTADRYASDLRFAPDGRTIASRGDPSVPSGLSRLLQDLDRYLFGGPKPFSTEVVVVDVETGERLARSGTSIHPIYSPDGRTIATRERDFSIKLRDVPGKAP